LDGRRKVEKQKRRVFILTTAEFSFQKEHLTSFQLSFFSSSIQTENLRVVEACTLQKYFLDGEVCAP
jgi:hypothetical protein